MKLSANTIPIRATRIPVQLVAGLVLIAYAWPMAWFGDPPLSEHTFFLLWMGYVLSVDGIVFLRGGTSLLSRSRSEFLGLFLASIPLWWLFEIANHFFDDWTYLTAHEPGWFAEHAEATICFATVIPAVFETAELYKTTWIGKRPWRFIPLDVSDRWLIAIAIGGAILFGLSLTVPRYFFPFVWIGVFFALDPINALAGQSSIAKQVAVNRWDTVAVLFAAGLTCGFYWEMWNYWSMPKWVYEITYADQYLLFEMPALGYGGYLPFALEVYAIYHFLRLIIRKPERGFLRFDKAGPARR